MDSHYFVKQLLSLVAVIAINIIQAPFALALDVDCSSSKGKVVINEIYSKDNSDFVEILVLEDNLDFTGWQMCYYDSNHGEQCSALNSSYSFGSYVTFDFSMNWAQGAEAILLDDSGDVVDYLFLPKKNCADATHWSVDSSCASCLDLGNSSDKDIARIPDGSGDWVGNDKDTSKGESNDGPIDVNAVVADYHLDECLWEGEDENSNSVYDVEDSSGNGLHGYAVKPPVSANVSSEDGGVCQAASMGGVSHLAVADNAKLDISNNLTVMAWVKPNSYPVGSNIKSILSKDTNYEFHIDSNGKIYWWWRWEPPGSGGPLMRSQGQVPLGEWSHIVIRYGDGVATIFINGTASGETTWNSSYLLRQNSDKLQIGGDFIADRYFDGSIDEVLIFDEALTDSMIRNAYLSQLNKANYDGSARACTACEEPSEQIVISTEFDGGQLGNPAINLLASYLVKYLPSTKEAELVRDLSEEFKWGWNPANAVHIDSSGQILFSVSGNGLTSDDLSVLGSQILLYDGNRVEVLHDFGQRLSNLWNPIDALYLYETGANENKWNVLFSTRDDGTWTQKDGSILYFQKDDLILLSNPDEDAELASLFFDGSSHFNGSSNIDGVHVINKQQLLLTTSYYSELGGLVIEGDDIVLYSPSAKVGTIQFNGAEHFTPDTGLRIDAITTVNSSSATIDHYEIVHDGSALTCGSPEGILVYACEDEGCTTYSSTEITVTLTAEPDPPATTTTASWIGGDNLTFIENGTASLQNFTAENVVIGMTGQTITPSNGYWCVNSVGGESVDCVMTFHDSGFEFDIFSQTSCKESDAIEISAVGKDPESGACVPRFDGRTVDIGFYSSYDSSTTGGPQIEVQGVAVSIVDTSNTPISLTFDENGKSMFTISYPDAGQLTLYARFDGAEADDELGLVMTGEDSFVVHPAGFCVYTEVAGNDCASADGTCSKFSVAGKEFELKTKAVCWEVDGEVDAEFCEGNTVTPSFQMADIGITHSLIAPLTGTAGAIGTLSVDINTDGEAAINQTVSEVGVFTFTADPVDDYLGATGVFAGQTYTSANIGRFIPNHFTVEISPSPPEFDNACNGVFTYLGQPFNWNVDPDLTIVAMNGATPSIQTENYEGSFWQLESTIKYAYEDTAVPQSGSPVSPVSTLTYTDTQKDISDTIDVGGTVTVVLDESVGFVHTRPSPENPVVPFDTNVSLTVLQVELTDNDGVCYEDVTGCTDFVVTDISGASMQHGQTLVNAVYGPETSSLIMPVSVITYNGTEWILNNDDDCTEYDYVLTPSGITVIGDPASPISISAGFGNITLTSAPANTSGTVLVEFDFPDWLHPDPTATATFGISRGNDRIINWQEIVR